MKAGHPFPRSRCAILLALAVAASAGAPAARADTYTEYILAKVGIRLGTLDGTYTLGEERQLIRVAYQLYLDQQRARQQRVGQVLINGDYPSALLGLGGTATLTFQFVDTATGLPSTGPAVDHVFYEANYDPNNPTAFVPLGTSFDAGSGFSLPFTNAGIEPEIFGIPFDAQNNPIVLEGTGSSGDLFGNNDAQGAATVLTTPEPATFTLVGIGLATLLGALRLAPGRGAKTMAGPGKSPCQAVVT
jgi:hypothetical protein